MLGSYLMLGSYIMAGSYIMLLGVVLRLGGTTESKDFSEIVAQVGNQEIKPRFGGVWAPL